MILAYVAMGVTVIFFCGLLFKCYDNRRYRDNDNEGKSHTTTPALPSMTQIDGSNGSNGRIKDGQVESVVIHL